jgi:hypothetical protein
MEWHEFQDMASLQFKDRDVCLGYRIGGSGEARMMTQLDCPYDWESAMAKMGEKVLSVRKYAARMEIKNLVSGTLLT